MLSTSSAFSKLMLPILFTCIRLRFLLPPCLFLCLCACSYLGLRKPKSQNFLCTCVDVRDVPVPSSPTAYKCSLPSRLLTQQARVLFPRVGLPFRFYFPFRTVVHRRNHHHTPTTVGLTGKLPSFVKMEPGAEGSVCMLEVPGLSSSQRLPVPAA